MTILNFPDNPAAVDNIYVAPNGVTYLYDGVKWSGQTLVGNTPIIDLAAVEQDIIPSTDNAYNLGSPDKSWKHIYAASGSIYLGDIKLTNEDGNFVATQVTNPGAVNETPVGPTGSSLYIPTDLSDLTDNNHLLDGGPTGPTGPSGFNDLGSLSITGSVIRSSTTIGISSGTGDQTNWVMTVNTNDGGIDSPYEGYINAVAYDSDGNTFSLGGYNTVGGQPGMFLIKTDPAGQVIFNNYYEEYYAFGFAMVVDNNDDVVFVMGEYDPSSADTVLVKVSGTNGTFIWQKYLADTDPSSNDVAISLDIDPNSNHIIIAGTTATSSNIDFWIGKFNGTTGNSIWQKQYDNSILEDTASGLAIDSQGNIGIVGSSYGGEQTFLPVFKVSGTDGSIMWETKIIAATTNNANSWIEGQFMSADMCVDSNDDFYFNLTGIYCYPWTVAGVHKVRGTDGTILWGKTINYPNFFNASSSIICDDENNVYALSTISTYRQQNQENESWRWASAVTKFNATGTVIWNKNLEREQSLLVQQTRYYGPTPGLFGKTIAVKDDYILFGGVQISLYPYDEVIDENQSWYNLPFLAQVDRAGTDFNVDGWHFNNANFPILDITLIADQDGSLGFSDLTESTADIEVFAGDVAFSYNTDTTTLSYTSASRVKTMTLDGATLKLPENGTIEFARATKGYITAIGGFDGIEGGNTAGGVWLYNSARDDAGNTYAGGYQYAYWAWDGSEGNVPMVYKTDSKGKLIWQAGTVLSQYGADVTGVAYDLENNTVVAVSTDNELTDGHEGFNVLYLDADTGSMTQAITHIIPSITGDQTDNDIYPKVLKLMSDGTPVVAGYVSSAVEKFADVTVSAAGLTGSTASGTLVVLKSKFARSGFSTEYPVEDDTWYVGSSLINHVNRYGDDESLTGGLIYTGTLGSGATFDVSVVSGAWSGIAINSGGSGYKLGQKVKILGTALGGTTPTNDLYLFVAEINGSGAITDLTGDTIADTIPGDGGPYVGVVSTAIAGTGLDGWVEVNPNDNTYTFWKMSNGTGYGVGDTVKILGSDLGGVNVVNDLTITVTAINDVGSGNGQVSTFTVSGTAQSLRIKLHVTDNTDFTQAGTYNIFHELNSDGFIWTPNWDLTLGGSGKDDNNSYDDILGMAIDSNDNVIVGGYSDSTGLDSNTTWYGNWSQSGFISKFSETGTLLWSVSIDGSEGNSIVSSIGVDADNNIYSAMNNYYDEHLYVTKLNSDGDLIWQQSISEWDTLSTTWSSDRWSLAVAENGDVLVAARAYNSDLDNDRHKHNDNTIIIKYDRDGNLLFSRLFWSTSSVSPASWLGNFLSIKGNNFSLALMSDDPGDNDGQGIVVDLPLDGTGIGDYGDFHYEEIELRVNYRFTQNNDAGGNDVVTTLTTLVSRPHNFVSAPYVNRYSVTGPSGPTGPTGMSVTVYGDRPHEVQTIHKPGGGDITGVTKIVFEDGTEQATTGQGLPQVKMSQVNSNGDYWVRLEDNGKHILMLWNNTVIIPSHDQVTIPVGFAFTIITDYYECGVSSYYNDDDIIGSGFGGTSNNSWTIPHYSMVTLVKITESKWMIAGPGITSGGL